MIVSNSLSSTKLTVTPLNNQVDPTGYADSDDAMDISIEAKKKHNT